MTGELNLWAFLAIGLVPSITSIVVALIQYSKGKSNLELEMGYLKKDVIDLKVDLKEDIECVERKLDKNIEDTHKIKDRVIVLEQNVLKGS